MLDPRNEQTITELMDELMLQQDLFETMNQIPLEEDDLDD